MSAGNYPSKSSKVIGVRLLNADHARVEARAAALATSPSLWARQVILEELNAPRAELRLVESLEGGGEPQEAILAETTLPEAEKALGETVTITETYDLKAPACPVTVIPAPELPWPTLPCAPENSRQAVRPARSWSDIWTELEQMEPAEAQERMKQLCAGRTLPREFKGWSRAERIAWLEKEWPL